MDFSTNSFAWRGAYRGGIFLVEMLRIIPASDLPVSLLCGRKETTYEGLCVTRGEVLGPGRN